MPAEFRLVRFLEGKGIAEKRSFTLQFREGKGCARKIYLSQLARVVK